MTMPEIYYIDGKESSGDDYLKAIASVGVDTLVVVNFGVQGRPDLAVGIAVGGLQIMRDEEKGSSWTSTNPVTLEEAEKYVLAYLSGDMSWVGSITWEKTIYSNTETGKRSLRVIIFGILLILIVNWIVKRI